MKLLLVHQNLPAQFSHLLSCYANDASHQVVAICQPYAPLAQVERTAGHRLIVYEPHRTPTKGIHNYLYSTEAAVLNGQAVASAVLRLQRNGFKPDLTLVHAGWGEALYIKDVLPDRPLLGYFEFFYRARGRDTNFDPEFPISRDEELRLRTRNAVHLLSLDACDYGVSPTWWQRDAYPCEYHPKLSVIHEGVDTAAVAPAPKARFELPSGTVLTRADEVVTFSARGLEPYRGFHRFMRALPALLRCRTGCQVVIAGSDDVSYGRKLAAGETWREKLLADLEIDQARVHFVGSLPWKRYLALLQVSTAHVYLTVPFVLSWSLLEAMSTGACVIGSDTAPVREVITHGENGVLVDYFDSDGLVDAIDSLCEQPDLRRRLSEAARHTVCRAYDRRDALMRYHRFFEDAVGELCAV